MAAQLNRGRCPECHVQDSENQPLSPESRSGDFILGSTDRKVPNPLFFSRSGLRAGWRLLIWMVICVLLLTAVRACLQVLRPHVSRDLIGDLARLLTVAAIVGATTVMARIERRSVWTYGLSDRRWSSHFFSGALVGWLALTLMLAGLRAAHHFYFGREYMHGSALLGAALLNAFSFLFEVALFEEILFRGYPLYTLADGIGFWPASLILSLLFAAAHVSNSGEAKVGIVAVAFFGLVLSFSIWRTGSLLWAIGFHFLWDYSETFIYGVPDSGFVSPQHLLSAKFVGPAWITGGTVGPEGSVFIFLVLALVAIIIHFQYPIGRFEFRASETAKGTKDHEGKPIPL